LTKHIHLCKFLASTLNTFLQQKLFTANCLSPCQEQKECSTETSHQVKTKRREKDFPRHIPRCTKTAIYLGMTECTYKTKSISMALLVSKEKSELLSKKYVRALHKDS